jgi:hypothetical protein
LTTFLLAGQATFAQMTMQPTSRPIVTADNEPWYVAGAPITFGGITYYPAGPMVHFNGNEMVRSGHFQGVPLYSRTTIEPYSLVFVPIGGGLMHPYERRREGDVAGTVGSVTPSFPVVRPTEQAARMEFVPGAGMVQAQAPPSQLGEAIDRIALAEIPQTPASALVGTTGAVAAPRLGPLTTARRPQGLNTIYIVYGTQRYFADGPAVEFDEKVFTRIGEYHGVGVYRHKGQDRTLYLSPRGGEPGVVAPYRAR